MKFIFKNIVLLAVIIGVSYGGCNSVFANTQMPKFQLKTEVTIKASGVSQFTHFFKLNDNQNSHGILSSGPKQILGLDWWEVSFQDGTKTWVQESNIKVDSVELVSNISPTISIYSATNDTLYLASSSGNGTVDDTLTMITTRFTSEPIEETTILKNTSTEESLETDLETTNASTIALITTSFEGEEIIGTTTSDFLSTPESQTIGDSQTTESNTIILFASILSSNSLERNPYYFLEKPTETSTGTGEILSEEVVSMITTFFRNQQEYSITIADIMDIPESTLVVSNSSSEEISESIVSTFSTYIGYINPFERNMPESEIELSSASEEFSSSSITSLFTTYTSEIKNWYNSK